jgi:hypothetical protein
MRHFSRNGVGADSTAYSYANYLLSFETRESAILAQEYFQLAIDSASVPAVAAAALVNSAPIKRDGLISGVPDWEGAIALYARAADLGMVVGMLNAGNVNCWIGENGKPERYKDAAAWYQRGLDFAESGSEPLDPTAGPPLKQTLAACKAGLVYLNVEGLIDGADRAAGLAVARQIAEDNSYAADVVERNVTTLLTKLRAPRSRTPAAHWKAVLQVLGWSFERSSESVALDIEGFSISAEVLFCQGEGRTIPFVVLASACLPLQKGLNVMLHAAATLRERFGSPLIVVGRKAIFRDFDDRCFTLAIVSRGDGAPAAVSIHLRASSPEMLVAQAEGRSGFGTSAFDGSLNCMVPIAVNVLDEGVSLSRYCNPDRMYAGVGGEWRLPYAQAENLLPLGVMVDPASDMCQMLGYKESEVILDFSARA